MSMPPTIEARSRAKEITNERRNARATEARRRKARERIPPARKKMVDAYKDQVEKRRSAGLPSLNHSSARPPSVTGWFEGYRAYGMCVVSSGNDSLECEASVTMKHEWAAMPDYMLRLSLEDAISGAMLTAKIYDAGLIERAVAAALVLVGAADER